MKRYLPLVLTAVFAVTALYVGVARGATFVRTNEGGTGTTTTPLKGSILSGAGNTSYGVTPVGIDGTCITASSTAAYGVAFAACSSSSLSGTPNYFPFYSSTTTLSATSTLYFISSSTLSTLGISTTTSSGFNPGLIFANRKNLIFSSDQDTNNFRGNIQFWNTSTTAKTGLEWYDYNGSSTAWLVSHYTNPGALPSDHTHIELETSDLSGAKQGRFTVGYNCDYDCPITFNQSELSVNRNSGQTNGNLLFNGGGQIRNTGVMQIIPNNGINTKGFRIATSTDDDIAIDVTGGTQLELLDDLAVTGTSTVSGRFGVGTTTPLRQSTIEASGSAGTTNGPMQAFRQNQGTINATTNSNLGEIYFTGADVLAGEEGIGAKIRAQASNPWNNTTNDYPTDLLFFTQVDGGATGLLERLRITNTGNVGIGTSTPTALLDVNGSFIGRATSTFLAALIDASASAGTSGQVFTSTGTSTKWLSTSSLGLSSGVTSITGTANQVIASASTGSVTLSLPQSIATSSSPTFAGLTIGSLSGFLKATAGAVSTALINLTSDVTGILPIANGGTGTSTVGSGGVVFASGTTLLSQDVASFFWDITNKRLGIGTAVPTARLMIAAGTTAANTSPLKFIAGALNTVAEIGAFEFDSTSTGTSLWFTSSSTSPTATTTALVRKRLSYDYTPAYIGTIAAPNGMTALVVNRGYFIATTVPAPVTVTKIAIDSGTATSGVDVAIYNQNGVLLGSSGSSTVTSAGAQSISLTAPVNLEPGWYYLAVSSTHVPILGRYTIDSLLGCTTVNTVFPFPATTTLPGTVSALCPSIAGVLTGGAQI